MADHRGKIAAGRISRHGDTVSIDAEPQCIGRNPLGCGQCIFDGRGEFVLRRETIVDRYHATTALVGKHSAHCVMGVEVAEDPRAAMKINDGGERIA